MIELDAAQECMNEFTTWLWDRGLEASTEEIDSFFAQRGTTRREIAELCVSKQIFIDLQLLDRYKEPEPIPGWKKLLKWMWN